MAEKEYRREEFITMSDFKRIEKDILETILKNEQYTISNVKKFLDEFLKKEVT